jgi:hypothetical protein
VLPLRLTTRQQRGFHRSAELVPGNPGGLDRLTGQALPLGGETEQQMQRADLVVTALAGVVLSLQDDDGRAVGEPAEVGFASREPLLHGLLRHAHRLADHRPGGAVATGLVDEVADQVVGEVADVVRDRAGARQVIEARRAIRSRLRDELVQHHASTLG